MPRRRFCSVGRRYCQRALSAAKTCAAERVRVHDILDPAVASRLRTPLQIEQHLTLTLETGYQASENPVGEAIVAGCPILRVVLASNGESAPEISLLQARSSTCISL